MVFSNSLVYWYLRNKRDLPWRNTGNPYYIWLSEIILQQTRVDQGMAYYLKFIAHFPTVQDLAFASEEEVLKLWQGLGYYSRARNLHFSAKYIVNQLNGNFPNTYNDLLKLKGVGDYTASAVASICFNEPTAVVDGNVYRVLARYFGIAIPINIANGIKEFKKLAQELIDFQNPGTHNQAIMEFGARMCKPQNPDCEICPLNASCIALSSNRVKELPVKENKLKIKKRYFNYLVIQTPSNKTKIVKRTKGIWMNLYEFPLIETSFEIDEQVLIENSKFEELFKNVSTSVNLFNKNVLVHKLTHQHIYTKFWIVETEDTADFKVNWSEIEAFPVSTLVHNFLLAYKTN
ncbi:A/G-specific adenine glycosylase [Lutibacter sp. HS1-25]|uniref:A/G-specific adenine glycosylase n=1 Tax=Lutibacter sp. HS1-25 TaxID=2485000 RepID=UPI001011359C|nr:A/G-specific adenine glycosylase [Lutibacter sp. HS1-25]RXP45886.1 A/G-specific adenine glycosylase [Lutibacter sp. HS1-25]